MNWQIKVKLWENFSTNSPHFSYNIKNDNIEHYGFNEKTQRV